MKYEEFRGVEGLVYAEVLEDTKEILEHGPVKAIAGVAEISKETKSDSATKYYDNVPALIVNSTGSDEIKMKISALANKVFAEITGQFYDETTGMLVDGERKSKYFAIGYLTETTSGDKVYVWRLKGTFGIPGSTHVTKNDGTDSNGQELTYTGINTTHKFTKTGETAKGINVEESEGKADITKFFEEVQTPDTIKAKTPSV